MKLTVNDFMKMLNEDVKINAFIGYETELDRYYDYDIEDFVCFERDKEVYEILSKEEFARLYGDQYVEGIEMINDNLIEVYTFDY